jgi:hypothetical protein
LIATEPEHWLDCFLLIRPGETYYQGKDSTVLCPNSMSDLLIGEGFDTVQATDQVAVAMEAGYSESDVKGLPSSPLRRACEFSSCIQLRMTGMKRHGYRQRPGTQPLPTSTILPRSSIRQRMECPLTTRHKAALVCQVETLLDPANRPPFRVIGDDPEPEPAGADGKFVRAAV